MEAEVKEMQKWHGGDQWILALCVRLVFAVPERLGMSSDSIRGRLAHSLS